MVPIRKELKERFIRELSASEKPFFLQQAREAVSVRGYPVTEDLFHYCYFLTLKERFRAVNTQGGAGYLRFLYVEGMRDVEDAIRLYAERLEKRKLPQPDLRGGEFIEYLSH